MKKYTKKALRGEAKRLEAFELTKECYQYEEDLYKLTRLHTVKTGEDYTKLSSAVFKFLDYYNIKISDFYRSFANASAKQLGYSCGQCGNSGQLHENNFLRCKLG